MDITVEYEKRGSFIHWFILASLAGIDVKGKITEVPRNLTMQLNGVETNPLAALTRLEQQFDELVAEKAQELFEEHKANILDPFEEQVKELTAGVSRLMSGKLKST